MFRNPKEKLNSVVQFTPVYSRVQFKAKEQQGNQRFQMIKTHRENNTITRNNEYCFISRSLIKTSSPRFSFVFPEASLMTQTARRRIL